MKKSVSKLLSVMCGLTTLFTMPNMNSASAEVYWSREGASTAFSRTYNCNYDLSNRASIEWFIGTVISKLDDFLLTHLNKTLYDLRTGIIRNITEHTINLTIRDRKLRFIQSLVIVLEVTARKDNESSEFVRKWLHNFEEIITSVTVAVDDSENGIGEGIPPISKGLIISAIEREDFGSMTESDLDLIRSAF